MKTFIAGSKSIHYLSDDTIQELNKIENIYRRLKIYTLS